MLTKKQMFSLLGGVVVVCGGLAFASPTLAADKVDFVKDVQPILQKSCVGCHGANDPKTGKPKIKGKLSLLDKESAMKGGDNGAKDIVAGKAEDSLVYKLLLGPVGKGDDEIKRMPAGKNSKPLDEKQVAVIKNWIDQGAEWPADAKLNPDAK